MKAAKATLIVYVIGWDNMDNGRGETFVKQVTAILR